MKVSYGSKDSYNCFVVENKYTTSKEEFNKYISKKNLSSLFATVGGQMEIDCGTDMKVTENYEKVSDEIMGCYFGHINGVESKNECYDNDILAKDNSKCCFIETSKIIDYGNIINDKRCYIIQNEYFTKEKNFSDYLLDASDNTKLNQIINTNITINCKNYAPFLYQGLRDYSKIKYYTPPSPDDTPTPIPSNNNESSGLQGWVIAVIVILIVIFICVVIIIVICIKNKKKDSTKNQGNENNNSEKKNNENNNNGNNNNEKNNNEKNNNNKYSNNEKKHNGNNNNEKINNENNKNNINNNQSNSNQSNYTDFIDNNIHITTENQRSSTQRNVQENNSIDFKARQ
jgi:hypothetical protein